MSSIPGSIKAISLDLVSLLDNLDSVVSLTPADPLILDKLLDEYSLLNSSMDRAKASLLLGEPVARDVFFKQRVRLISARVKRVLRILNKADKSFSVIGPIREGS